jgi:hypothetical protein
MGAALQRFATDTTCNDTGNAMADPTSYSARWIRLWPLQIVLIARAEESCCGHRYTTSLPV